VNEIQIQFKGDRDATGPLTWPQRRTWRGSRFKYRLVGIQPLPQGRTLQEVCDAITWAYGAFEALRTTYPSGPDGEPYQKVKMSGSAGIRLVEGREPTLEADIQAAVDAFKRERHDIETEIGVVFALMISTGVPTHLICLGSHLALDAYGYQVLRGALNDHLSGKPHVAPTSSMQPIERALTEQLPLGQEQNVQALRYWRTILEKLPTETTAHQAATMTSPALRTAASYIAMRHRASASSVCLAAVAVVAGALTKRSICSFKTMVSNRFTPEERSLVGELVQFAPGIIDSLDDSFEVIVRDTWQATLNGYKFGHYDEQALLKMIDDMNERDEEELLFDIAFNDTRSTGWENPRGYSRNLQEMTGQTVVEPRAHHYQGPSRYISVALWNLGKEDLSVNVHRGRFPGVDVQRIPLAIEALLVGVATGEPEQTKHPLSFISEYLNP